MRLYGVELIESGDMVCLSARNNGHFEPESMTAWLDVAQSSDNPYMVDVGAYTGLYALAAARHGANVLALEPNPNSMRRMRANMAANPCPDGGVVDMPCAAGDMDGSSPFTLHGRAHMTSAASLSDQGEYMVPVTTIDALCQTASPVRAIKIDVEGYELSVLRGAHETLSRHHPLVIAEALTPDAADGLIAHMQQYGYTHAYADKRNLIFHA